MGAVLKMSMAERVLLNPDRLVELCVSMGEPAAEALVTASIDDIANGTSKLPRGSFLEDQASTLAKIKHLSAIAEHIGLTTFVRVARDIEDCAECKDHPAYAATLDRLRRVAAKAQTALWDLQDMMV